MQIPLTRASDDIQMGIKACDFWPIIDNFSQTVQREYAK